MPDLLRVIVVGLGVQGHKRRHHAGTDCVATVDPYNPEADYRSIEEVRVGDYDAALCCIPDEPKYEIVSYLLSRAKHVLVEKPLWTPRPEQVLELQQLARRHGVICYTAYNHRFEPHYVRMRDLIRSGELGRIYSCRMFYGNGTARLVRDSEWRDRGAGVLPDLGSHLLDTCRFWFGDLADRFQVYAAHSFENRAPDHIVIGSESLVPRLELEMTLLMWRNHFTCDVLAENGSAHIESLCKWGPSVFTRRRRVLPSGRPQEEAVTLVQDDPTWASEYDHFKRLCASGAETDLADDLWLARTLSRLGDEVRAHRMAPPADADPFLGSDHKLRPSPAVAALIVLPDGRYLLQRRDPLPQIFYPDHWGCFGGAIDDGEKPDEALLRELREELGFDIEPGSYCRFTETTFDYGFAGLGVMPRIYYAVMLDWRSLDRLALGEGSDFAAFEAETALCRLRMTPYDSYVLWLYHQRHRIGGETRVSVPVG
jgi:predicted dehydrogenase/8-oxo-dGTP pyrophosphatase MutT (NUDIX family)